MIGIIFIFLVGLGCGEGRTSHEFLSASSDTPVASPQSDLEVFKSTSPKGSSVDEVEFLAAHYKSSFSEVIYLKERLVLTSIPALRNYLDSSTRGVRGEIVKNRLKIGTVPENMKVAFKQQQHMLSLLIEGTMDQKDYIDQLSGAFASFAQSPAKIGRPESLDTHIKQLANFEFDTQLGSLPLEMKDALPEIDPTPDVYRRRLFQYQRNLEEAINQKKLHSYIDTCFRLRSFLLSGIMVDRVAEIMDQHHYAGLLKKHPLESFLSDWRLSRADSWRLLEERQIYFNALAFLGPRSLNQAAFLAAADLLSRPSIHPNLQELDQILMWASEGQIESLKSSLIDQGRDITSLLKQIKSYQIASGAIDND